jgi:hypothetical protein
MDSRDNRGCVETAHDEWPSSLAECQSTNLAVASAATACAVTPMLIGAGDPNRTGDIQLGKLAFGHSTGCPSCSLDRAECEWWLQRDSNPRFGLERVATKSAVTRTYRVVATGGCHGAFELARPRHSRQAPDPAPCGVPSARHTGFTSDRASEFNEGRAEARGSTQAGAWPPTQRSRPQGRRRTFQLCEGGL